MVLAVAIESDDNFTGCLLKPTVEGSTLSAILGEPDHPNRRRRTVLKGPDPVWGTITAPIIDAETLIRTPYSVHDLEYLRQ